MTASTQSEKDTPESPHLTGSSRFSKALIPTSIRPRTRCKLNFCLNATGRHSWEPRTACQIALIFIVDRAVAGDGAAGVGPLLAPASPLVAEPKDRATYASILGRLRNHWRS